MPLRQFSACHHHDHHDMAMDDDGRSQTAAETFSALLPFSVAQMTVFIPRQICTNELLTFINKYQASCITDSEQSMT